MNTFVLVLVLIFPSPTPRNVKLLHDKFTADKPEAAEKACREFMETALERLKLQIKAPVTVLADCVKEPTNETAI